MEAKHTPGPWHFKPAPRGILTKYRILSPTHSVSCDDYSLICEVSFEANARLIAAAPDLLEACTELFKAFEQLLPGIGKIVCRDYANINEAPILARAAIAKAEGKPA